MKKLSLLFLVLTIFPFSTHCGGDNTKITGVVLCIVVVAIGSYAAYQYGMPNTWTANTEKILPDPLNHTNNETPNPQPQPQINLDLNPQPEQPQINLNINSQIEQPEINPNNKEIPHLNQPDNIIPSKKIPALHAQHNRKQFIELLHTAWD
ncbi:MAG TPA: hypothetical protein VLB80_01725 [Candidatus Babeliales bacterium]|nr:hypothetical protein [Candidatus Babeliales bacterium]